MAKQIVKPKGKVFRDPVHRLIRIEPEDQFILDLISTPEMQRLRRVRQLGVSSLTYHGAEHSRFVHSLGVFNFAQKIVATLRRRYGPSNRVIQELESHSRVLKAAALLHDIGHGPFSHMIERASIRGFDHEQMTSRIIREDGAIRRALIINEIDPESVARVIAKTYPHQLVVDIVSSQLDADRMDYLLRDSLMTGVEYGVYDSEWLLNSMCVGLDPGYVEAQGSSEHALRLCLDRDRGLFAAEQLILARHHMMLQVYMHRVTRGYEVMLLNLFRRMTTLSAEHRLPEGTPKPVVAYFQSGTEMTREQWLLFDESAMVSAIQAWSTSSDEWVARMSNAYLRRERVLHGFSVGRLGLKQSMSLPEKLVAANLKKGLDWEVDWGEHLPYKGIFSKAAKEGGEEEQSTLSILLSDGSPDKRGRAIENESGILQGLDNERQSVARLYLDLDKLDQAKPVLAELGIEQGGAS